jgi:hypothetical protein
MAARRRFAQVAAAAMLALATGCGATSGGSALVSDRAANNPDQPPATELTGAIAALGHTSTLTAVVSLGASASQIDDLASALGATLTPAETAALAGARVSVEVTAPAGRTVGALGADDASAASEVTLSSNDTNYLSVRRVGSSVYLQADLKDLLSLVGESSAYSALKAEAVLLPGAVRALVDGQWISLPDSALQALGQLSRGLGHAPSDALSPDMQRRLITGLDRVLRRDVTVTRTRTGTVDQLLVTANTRVVANGLLRTLADQVPGLAALPVPRVGSGHGQGVSLTADVVGGALRTLTVNLSQGAGKTTPGVPLDVMFSRGGAPITAPSGAVAVDTLSLTGLYGALGGLGGLGGAGLGA